MELALYEVLVLTWWVSTISLAARYRVAACSTSLSQGGQKIQAHNSASIFALSLVWEEFLELSTACSTLDAFNVVCRLDRDGKLDEAPQNKKQVATGLLRDNMSRLLLNLSPYEPPKFWDRLVDTELRTSSAAWNLFSVFLVLGLLLVSFAPYVSGCAQLKIFQTEEHDHTCRFGCLERLRFYHGEAIHSMT